MPEERIPANEDHFRDQLIDMLRAKMTRENPTVMHRDAHPKQHGLVKAHFCIEGTLPNELQHGIFQPNAQYKAWVRFSNSNAPARDDYEKDIRGAAIKLMNVPGDKLPLEDGNSTSQDFATVTAPMFLTHDVEEFAGLVKGLVGSKIRLLWFLLSHPRTTLNLVKSNKRFYSPLEARYWSMTPYKLGDKHVVKYSLIPHAKASPLNKPLGPDFLRTHMAEQLSKNEYTFDFCVQLQKDPVSMPIEDAGKRWSEEESPFVKVATLTIAQQTFDTPEQNLMGRNLSFNPWHSLPAHKPLGGINRARRVIYETLSQYRHSKNNMPIQEPTDYTIPESILSAAKE